MIKIEELEKELNQGILKNIYLLYGEELFLLENTLKKIRNVFGECIKGINYIPIDDTNISGIISDIETPAFGYERKLIVARNSGILKKEGKRKNAELGKIRDRLARYLEENKKLIEKSVVLVFIEEDVDNRTNLYKTIDKLGGYKVNISDSNLRYFIECCGTNMQELINEIRKLIEFAGENGTIQKEDIDKLCIKKLESVIFDLTDSLGKKETGKALQVLKNLLYAKEPIQKILITLYNHFKRLYFTKMAIKYNKDIISTLNLKPNQTFLVNKYKTQARFFEEKDLKEILQNLRDLDYHYKIGLIDLQIGLESILCRYCS